MNAAFQLDFSRFEFKYVLQQPLVEAVEAELAYFMQLDPFVEESETYFVRSLYFDDPFNSAFYDKIDGLKTRSKFRIRTYTRTENDQVPVFLEEKGRHDNKVFKQRALLSAGSSLEYGSTQLINDILASTEKPETVINKFQHQWFKKGIRPIALIDYLRKPYISKYDHEFRVTFDERLQATETDLLFPPKTAQARRLVPGYTIMEVKFGYKVPAWFHRIIQSFELRRVSISKICEGMKVLQLAQDL